MSQKIMKIDETFKNTSYSSINIEDVLDKYQRISQFPMSPKGEDIKKKKRKIAKF